MKFNYYDTVNFLSKLNVFKLWNIFKLRVSFYISSILKQAVIWGVPMSISFEPTTACNLRCPECPSGLRSFKRETGNLKSDFFKTSIDQIYRRLVYLIFYFQGEPYINPDFLDMVSYANKKGLYTITSTNGHFLNDENCVKTIESGLDRLIISIDGTTQDTYAAYRKEGSLNTVLAGAKNIIRWKEKLNSKTPHVIFQFLVVRPNENQIPDMMALADEIGVDELRLKTAQLYDYKYGNPLMPENEKYSRYKKHADGSYTIKNKIINQCWKMWHSCVITWNGLIVPCCFDKDATHQMGDLKKDALSEVWQNKTYQNFRSAILLGRDKIEICNNCSEGCKVWA